MEPRAAPRSLSFEQLEQKLSPTGLLLALAPLQEADQQALEAWLVAETRTGSTASAWRCEHTTQRLLEFVEQQTQTPTSHHSAKPTPEACTAADTWLRLTEATARDAVMAESPHWKHL